MFTEWFVENWGTVPLPNQSFSWTIISKYREETLLQFIPAMGLP
jgi:hypothetical protein